MPDFVRSPAPPAWAVSPHCRPFEISPGGNSASPDQAATPTTLDPVDGTPEAEIFRIPARSEACLIAGRFWEPTMLTHITQDDWEIVLEVFQAVRSRRGCKEPDDRRFLEALLCFTVFNITWCALLAKFGPWNTVWRRFWRLSQSGYFDAYFDALASCSRTAGSIQMFDSTSIRAHVSAAGAKGGSKARRSGSHAAASAPRSTSSATSTACRSTFT